MFKWEDIDLLVDTHWQGIFFPPDKPEERFFGTLFYSVAEGLYLDYTILGADVPNIEGVLHGVLASGDAVTLFRSNNWPEPGLSFQYGIHTRSGKAHFWAMYTGLHFENEPNLQKVDFTLSGLDEFIAPQGSTAHIPWSMGSIIAVKIPGGTLKIINVGKVQPLGNISSVLINKNPHALAAVESNFKKVQAEFPKDLFVLKKEMHHAVRLEYDAPVTVMDALKRITDIAALFALLVRSPVHPRRISFDVTDSHGGKAQIFVFPATLLDEATVRLALSKKNHHLMPITMQNSGLGPLLSAWLTEAANYQVLVSGLQHKTGYHTRHDIHGAIVLSVTQIEAISFEEGGPKGQKFEYAINKYASSDVLALLKHHLGAGDVHGVGAGVSDIRNEIAHVGKPAKLLKKLTFRDLSDIAAGLELTVVGYVLRKLGVTESVVFQYQNDFCPEFT